MDVTLNGEQEMVRKTAREFADREIAPFARDWDRAEEMDRGIVAKLAEVGFLGAPLPEEYGGGGLGCFCLTEPGTGSDAGNLEAKAERDGDGWVLSGSKMFITNGTWAGV